MIDISEITTDIKIVDSQVMRASNVISSQLGGLTYAPTFGSDLKYFLTEPYEFENQAFKSYLLQRLAEHSIDVSGVTETVENLFVQLGFSVNATKEGSGLVR